MTSVAVIYSVVASLKVMSDPLPDGADGLMEILNKIKEPLKVADGDHQNREVENQIVRFCYDIDPDAIAALPKKAATKKLQELKGKLDELYKQLTKNPEQVQEKAKSRSSSFFDRLNVYIPKSEKASASNSSKEDDSENKQEEMPGTDVDILKWVKERPSESWVFYIVGKSGMGKSTCAKKLFDKFKQDPSYVVCAWVGINHNFQIKRVLQILLQKLDHRLERDIKAMTEIDLNAQIFAVLKDKTYLLVLDDVKSVGDWESIRLALPFSGSARVIITSSCTDFNLIDGEVYKIPRMTEPIIVELLEKEAPSFKLGCRKEVWKEVGEATYHASGGSPLLATILGKSLQAETDNARQEKMVSQLTSYQPEVLAVCYTGLAPEIKPCLLYLSQFGQYQNIEVEKLYLLLVAENLIFSPKESQTALKSLKDHLEELVRRNLVEVQENVGLRKENNKSYTLHSEVQEFCKSQASKEEFLEIVEMGKLPVAKVGLHTRRLAVHLSKVGGNMSMESKETMKKILSLLIFDIPESAEEKSHEWPKEINDLKEFIRLRILKYDGVNFEGRKALTGIHKLVHLRYLSFRGCWLEELPSSLSKLTQLETLDLVVQAECEMRIPNNILNEMTRMVHLYFPRSYRRSEEKRKLQLQHMKILEILVNFDMAVCDVEALSNFNNLRILSTISNGDPKDLEVVVKFIITRAKLLEYSSVDIRGFDCYDEARVSALEKLLQCEFIDSIHIEGQIGTKLPEKGNRRKRLADIVLNGSEIEADPIEYLGIFENLMSLVLTNDAFVGKEIVISASLFPILKTLQLNNLNYLTKLTIEQGAMPQLSTLQINSCAALQELSIPKELNDRLKKAQGDGGGDAYCIMPLPPIVNFIP